MNLERLYKLHKFGVRIPKNLYGFFSAVEKELLNLTTKNREDLTHSEIEYLESKKIRKDDVICVGVKDTGEMTLILDKETLYCRGTEFMIELRYYYEIEYDFINKFITFFVKKTYGFEFEQVFSIYY